LGIPFLDEYYLFEGMAKEVWFSVHSRICLSKFLEVCAYETLCIIKKMEIG
jgi:hypothetical protein